METSPLLRAVTSSLDTGLSEANTISYNEMSYLLTVMLTISGISILVLVISVFTILVFIWYTRNLLTRKCGCPNSQSANVDILYQQAGNPRPPRQQHCGQPVQMYMVDQAKIYRPNKNVTVNPLPAPNLCNQLRSGERKRNLEPSIKESQASDRSADYSIFNTDNERNHRNLDEATVEAEPIYAEIKVKETEKTDEKSNYEVESKQNKSGLKEQHQDTKGKKEIEYWQITAKEVVKFRPCTETFIVRE